jgi:hypothetical protein
MGDHVCTEICDECEHLCTKKVIVIKKQCKLNQVTPPDAALGLGCMLSPSRFEQKLRFTRREKELLGALSLAWRGKNQIVERAPGINNRGLYSYLQRLVERGFVERRFEKKHNGQMWRLNKDFIALQQTHNVGKDHD